MEMAEETEVFRGGMVTYTATGKTVYRTFGKEPVVEESTRVYCSESCRADFEPKTGVEFRDDASYEFNELCSNCGVAIPASAHLDQVISDYAAIINAQDKRDRELSEQVQRDYDEINSPPAIFSIDEAMLSRFATRRETWKAMLGYFYPASRPSGHDMTGDFYYCATCDLAYELMDTDVYFNAGAPVTICCVCSSLVTLIEPATIDPSIVG